MHDLVRAFGQDRSRDQDDEQERRAVVHRLLDHYVHTTRLAAHQLFAIRHQILPERPVDGVICEAPEPADWYQSEYTALLAALDLADRERFDRHRLARSPRCCATISTGKGCGTTCRCPSRPV
ncbi:hypothetical protein RKD25_009074 [Streptomyces sp. SAI-124]|uniref:hypothetical protein n=1 Tax=Streptomyces sp. SAI-124 TaxID=3377730 RepID=UPI003C7E4E79